MNLFDLTGKKALVTGGASGLGLAMAEGLHEAGAAVGLLDIAENTTAIAEGLGTQGALAFGVRADLSRPDEVERGFREMVTLLGGLDILVNNVGITRRSPTEEHSLSDWEAVLQVNMTTTFLMSKLAAQIMLRQGYGKIINIGSLYSFIGGPNQIGYTASKGAIRLMTMAMSNEWAGRGINVNAIAPGYMATPLNAPLRADPEWHRRVMDRIPMQRYGTPDDLKGVVIFLASAASDYITGVTIPVDGGFLGR
ncbi:MAG: SDR family NAD(P)-dependent oxidoreductase [Anaerolineae bacterium]